MNATEEAQGIHVDLGPITGAANANQTVVVDGASRRQASWYDVQDGREHNVRGLSLTELLAYAKAPKAADTVVFTYTDGMAIPVRLRDTEEVAYEAELAQATRRLPDRSGWPLYLRHCQSCHGIGGHGAKRGPDFLSDMDAYRREPALAVTDLSQHPSLHEKVKGFTEGKMPVLNHISDKDIAILWRWLHAIHAGATK